MLEIAQSAMDELGRSRGCGTGEIGLLEEDDAQPPPGSVTRNAAAIYPAADHREIVGRVGRLFLPLASATMLVSIFAFAKRSACVLRVNSRYMKKNEMQMKTASFIPAAVPAVPRDLS